MGTQSSVIPVLIGSHKYLLLTVSDALTDSFRFVSLSVSDWSVSAAFVVSITLARNIDSAESTSAACAVSFTTPNSGDYYASLAVGTNMNVVANVNFYALVIAKISEKDTETYQASLGLKGTF